MARSQSGCGCQRVDVASGVGAVISREDVFERTPLHPSREQPAPRRGNQRRRRPNERMVSVGGHEHEPASGPEHTSELQSLAYLVCRLLLEKKKITQTRI